MDEPPEPNFAATTDLDVETDVLFAVLADSRRRFVLACLDEYATPMALADVADELATWELDVAIAEVPATEVKTIYIALYHVHIPKMEAAGMVEYSQKRDAVRLTDDGEDLPELLDLPPIGE